MKLKYIILATLSLVLALPSLAVTDKEMDQAKAIAAKLYLRWTNNGSGYLDEVSVSSMLELESKLKAKEKENLKVFNSVSIPSDYASWDKKKLVEFWGTTFFTSPALNAEGKKAKDRIRKQIEAMTVAAPQAKAEEPAKPAEPTTPSAASTDAAPEPSAEAALEEQEKLLADQNAIAEEMEKSQPSAPKNKNNTWIYIVILVILVGLVIWLMVYAANMMKRQGAEAKALAGTSPEDKERIKRFQNEVDRLNAQLTEARANEKKLKEEIGALNSRLASSSQVSKETSAPKPEPKPEPKIPSEIYLGRSNAKGQFVRGDRRPVPGHTVYVLETKDGNVGTFRFAGTPEATELALSNPFQFLAGGCNSDNFEDAETATGIITETPGTAIFENNCWKVLRKSRIRFE